MAAGSSQVAVAAAEQFAASLLDWQAQHGRHDLPWQVQDGYRVWLSEIMLQQTQVTTVIPYYLNFLSHFPSITDLANAELDGVLAQWQGLGYYARARNLHKAAQQMRDEFDGQFPNDLEAAISLPGVGRSTAAAILSFVYGQSHAILDGNVKRVLARCYQVDGWYGQTATQKKLWALTESLTPQAETGRFNQAMMDLGSMIYLKSRPLCAACPVSAHCLSYQNNTQAEFPHKKPKKEKPLKHTVMLLVKNGDRVMLQKRPMTGIWGGLWSLPEVEDESAVMESAWLSSTEYAYDWRPKVLQHQFTHYSLNISLAVIETDQLIDSGALAWVEWQHLGEYGLPAPVRKILLSYNS